MVSFEFSKGRGGEGRGGHLVLPCSPGGVSIPR